jgi:hypothetical protein
MSVVLWQPRKPDPFRGLHLAPRARKALQREGITTLDELRVVADQIHQFEGYRAQVSASHPRRAGSHGTTRRAAVRQEIALRPNLAEGCVE